jgi:GTPase KRas protein
MLDMWINFGDGFLLVYAVNDKESLEALEKKKERILKAKKGVPCPIVVVGNKCDLERERTVDEQNAKNMAAGWNASYIETSATVFIFI